MSIALNEFYRMLLLLQVCSLSYFESQWTHISTLINLQVDQNSPAAASISSAGDSPVVVFASINLLTLLNPVQNCMQSTVNMIVAQIGNDGFNPSTIVTEQVCLRRCMLTLQKLQLWLFGISASVSHQMEILLQPCSWLFIQPVNFSLVQLQTMAECLFPSQIMNLLSPHAASAAKINLCFLGSAFERHVLLALLHPLMTLPLDNTFKGIAQTVPDECDTNCFSAALRSSNSVFVHTLHCIRMSIRHFLQSFNSIGKPSHPQSEDFLKFMHDFQVWALKFAHLHTFVIC